MPVFLIIYSSPCWCISSVALKNVIASCAWIFTSIWLLRMLSKHTISFSIFLIRSCNRHIITRQITIKIIWTMYCICYTSFSNSIRFDRRIFSLIFHTSLPQTSQPSVFCRAKSSILGKSPTNSTILFLISLGFSLCFNILASHT